MEGSSVAPPEPGVLRPEPLVLLPQRLHLAKVLLEEGRRLALGLAARAEHVEVEVPDLAREGGDERVRLVQQA